MNNLILLLEDYAKNPSDPEKNYLLALAYDSVGQTAAASTHYLRAAERYTHVELAYESLIRYALCYHKQGNRNHTVSCLLKHAINTCPKRPEAYYLISKLYEVLGEYSHCYFYANLGMLFADTKSQKLRSEVLYPGEYGLLFQKAVSSWYWGKTAECRELFLKLKNDYWDNMDSNHKELCASNLSKLGCSS